MHPLEELMPRAVILLMILSSAAACRGRAPELTGAIKIDGSSTMFPLTSAAVKAFAKPHPAVQISVAVSGTGGGFRTFCRGEVEIQDASRPISGAERMACEESDVSFIELPVAQDAVTIIVHPSNDWLKSLSIADLKKMWATEADGRVMRWSDVNAQWPSQPIHLFGPGTLSGTFDFFTAAVAGAPGASRRDYTASEDDNVIVKSVADDRLALGYVGHGYFERNKGSLRAVAIAGPDADRLGAVLPTEDNVRRGVYAPLARTLLLYVNSTALDRPAVSAFVNFYVDQAEALTRSVHGIVLTGRSYDLVKQRVKQRIGGTLFADGRPAENLERMLSATPSR
jgi:phosphate transport system substrate-binding protein